MDGEICIQYNENNQWGNGVVFPKLNMEGE